MDTIPSSYSLTQLLLDLLDSPKMRLARMEFESAPYTPNHAESADAVPN